jgi:hypothetical protein
MKIALTAGAYEARSAIADAQRCINLYAEKNPKDAPFPETCYPTPGTVLVTTAPVTGEVRAEYTASNGNLYVVVDDNVYYVSPAYAWTLLGTLTTSTGFVSIKDNTMAAVIVDGTAFAFCIKLSDNSWNSVSATNFYAADVVDYLDTYLIFNRKGTNQFFFSLSNADFAMFVGGTAFDPLDIAAKTGGNDNIVGLRVMHRELWLIGERTSEVWFDAGATDFAFQAMPGAFVEHGCTAVGSIAKYDLAVYWLGQDAGGANVVFEGAQYRVRTVSTKAIDREIATYATTSDALGFTYLQEGHVFYVLIFPSANVTWVFDLIEEKWHRRCWSDTNGILNRWRANCFTTYAGQLLVGDFENGKIYALDLDTYLDGYDGTDGDPITRIRSFPHTTAENDRLVHKNFILAMEVGNEMSSATNDNDQVSLRWSDNAGRSYGEAVLQSIGPTGNYIASLQWNRLGLARDRVYEASWSAPVKTSIQGAYLEVTKAAT